MAGKPGRSGGARPGAGRPPKAPTLVDLAQEFDDPQEFLKRVMNSPGVDLKMRVDAGKALMPFAHAKPGDKGKKNTRIEAATQLMLDGLFAPPTPTSRLQ